MRVGFNNLVAGVGRVSARLRCLFREVPLRLSDAELAEELMGTMRSRHSVNVTVRHLIMRSPASSGEQLR
jgi:hypothetical protein